MSNPFDRPSISIPVTVVTRPGASAPSGPGAARIVLAPSRHAHEPGGECVACASRHDVRTMLFDLLQRSQHQNATPVLSVIVDASALIDPSAVLARLRPGAPALGLRDHTVARSFHLARII